MSDPLSIAAGIAGFLSLGIQVTQTLVDFYSAYKSRDNEVAKITQNIENLQSAFRSLEIEVQQRQIRADADELLQEVDKATQRCQEILQELQIECQKLYNDSVPGFEGRVRVAGRRAAYPFRKSTMQKIDEDITTIRENLSFALSVLQLKSHSRIEDGISDVKALLERTNISQISDIIRVWLMAPDASVNHNNIYAKHHPSTGLWLVNNHQFTHWLIEHNSFLWLNGFAGCGKSVLCSIAIQHTFLKMQDTNAVGVAFFYFAFNDESKQNDHGMLRALLLQLSVQFQDGEKELKQLHASYNPRTPPLEALLGLLRTFLCQFQDSYIFLDALDESPRHYYREGVLRAIQAIRDWSLPSVHLLVTSRDLLDIRRSLIPYNNQSISVRCSPINKDISAFVSHQLDNDLELQRWKVRHSEIEAKLIQGAQGVFRYVECQLNAFRRAKNGNQLDECLRSLPRDLDETYERILCSIDEAYVEDVRRILTVLCFSARPLNVSELIDAHAVELGHSSHLDREGRSYELNGILEICLGLVEVSEVKYGCEHQNCIARIAHSSVQEYLQSERMLQRKAARFKMRKGPANAEIAQICLVYLLEPMLSTGELNEKKLMEFPFAHFAAMYWFHHYEISEDRKPDVQKLVVELFKTQKTIFRTWIKLYNVDRPTEGVNFNLNLDTDTMGSRLYYASLLGLDWILSDLIFNESESPKDIQRIVNTIHWQYGYGSALVAASYRGHEKVVQILLHQGADVNALGGESCSNALEAASSRGHEEVVRMLLVQGADVNAHDGFHTTALQSAVHGGYEIIMQMLLTRGADINLQGGGSGSALQAASYHGYEDIVQMLLARGADINLQGGGIGSALQAASYGGHEDIVQMLLAQGADINLQGGKFGSALQAASSQGHEKAVQLLLDEGADPDGEDVLLGSILQNGQYASPICGAAHGGYKTIVQMLLERGANVNTQGGALNNALQAASDYGDQDIVQMLLARGAKVDVQGGTYGNALQAASFRGHEEIMQILIDQGADVNALSGGLYSNALQAASSQGHEKAVQLLLTRGTNVNIQGGILGNALQAASFHGNEKIVQILLEHGADVNAPGGGIYSSALQAASTLGHGNVVQILLDRVANLDAKLGLS
ncbi:hypothetical protein N7471_001751 [Penicillium samsonianum]|uniref:uncharacterized protein n=1 Tax=Penicillium samsonianum TaxID=1882272 RepID=UPI002546BE9F|nr:uncharacterized protein N7471_001751 [Penicillium samsonianum]KAJ6150552.1 hypothetical protein N7471_001751 [Penicillium samsonianum]